MLTLHHDIHTDYYTRPEVSCSTLKSLKQALTLKSRPENLQAIFDYGSLVDALITEEENIDHLTNTLHLAHGGSVQFSKEDWDKACFQRLMIMRDPVAKLIFDHAETQVVGLNDRFEFTYNGFKFNMPVRLKMDGLLQRIQTGADLKTTSCTTLKQCIASIDMFDYDMQGSYYMDIMNLDRFWFVFSSKKGKKEVFRHAMQRGDEMYQSGLAKYSYWAYQYYMLVWSMGRYIS